MTRYRAIEIIMKSITDEIVVNCNGMIGRECFTIKDRPANFYMIGSMGLASSIGLGIATCKPEKKVIVLDGDGNVLMNMSTLAMAVALNPNNYYHICLDNEVYGSTGDQETISNVIYLDKIASACGYKHVFQCDNEKDLENIAHKYLSLDGPVFILIKVEKGNVDGMKRVSHTPEEMTERFSQAVQS